MFPQLHRSSTGRPLAVILTSSSRLSQCQLFGFQVSRYVVAVDSTGSRISAMTTSARPACSLLFFEELPVTGDTLNPEVPLVNPVV